MLTVVVHDLGFPTQLANQTLLYIHVYRGNHSALATSGGETFRNTLLVVVIVAVTVVLSVAVVVTMVMMKRNDRQRHLYRAKEEECKVSAGLPSHIRCRVWNQLFYVWCHVYARWVRVWCLTSVVTSGIGCPLSIWCHVCKINSHVSNIWCHVCEINCPLAVCFFKICCLLSEIICLKLAVFCLKSVRNQLFFLSFFFLLF